jgi:hypothetical protein
MKKTTIAIALLVSCLSAQSQQASLKTGILIGGDGGVGYMVGGSLSTARNGWNAELEAYHAGRMNGYDEEVRNKALNLSLNGMVMLNGVYRLNQPVLSPYFFAGAGVQGVDVYRAGYYTREEIEGTGKYRITEHPKHETTEITAALQAGAGLNVNIDDIVPNLYFDLCARIIEGMDFSFEESDVSTRNVGLTMGFTYIY